MTSWRADHMRRTDTHEYKQLWCVLNGVRECLCVCCCAIITGVATKQWFILLHTYKHTYAYQRIAHVWVVSVHVHDLNSSTPPVYNWLRYIQRIDGRGHVFQFTPFLKLALFRPYHLFLVWNRVLFVRRSSECEILSEICANPKPAKSRLFAERNNRSQPTSRSMVIKYVWCTSASPSRNFPVITLIQSWFYVLTAGPQSILFN